MLNKFKTSKSADQMLIFFSQIVHNIQNITCEFIYLIIYYLFSLYIRFKIFRTATFHSYSCNYVLVFLLLNFSDRKNSLFHGGTAVSLILPSEISNIVSF